MDFIKTSSLRALIELTFQRNWNGLIWMSRKGVITKRVKTVQTALSRTRQPRSRLAEERMFRVGQIKSVRPSRPKFQTIRPIRITTRETMSRGRPRQPTNDDAARAGKQASRPRNLARTTADARPSREATSRVRPRNIGQLHPSDQRPTTNPSGHDRSDSAMTRLSGRSSRRPSRTPRSTRSPFHVFSSPA
ncbi:unnamed protein product [Microthlaspi erraticum]|uniref:Uncharacterized protein n=1 Tax=Microthlaspi erraticum TaxID=1685480 RepID=A0A6D2KJG5_9BRAS|nr:unnamed protein product [Microthlaspi erraticum]